MPEKTESLNQVALPEEGKIKILNKDKERPNVVFKTDGSPDAYNLTTVSNISNFNYIDQNGGKEVVRKTRRLELQVSNPFSQHSHL